MIQYETFDDSKEINHDQTDKSKECEICNYNYLNNGFQSDSKVSDSKGSCVISTVNDVDYNVCMFDITEDDVIDSIKDFEPNEL